MEQPAFDIAGPLIRYLEGAATVAETQAVEQWLKDRPENQQLYEQLKRSDWLLRQAAFYGSLQPEPGWQKLQAAIPELAALPVADKARVIPLRRTAWLRVAAAVLLLTIGYLLLPTRQTPVADTAQAAVIAPGREGAVLQLADGSRILLDSAGNGLLATEGGSRVLLDKGQLRYEAAATPASTAAFNTMSTPRGRQFQLSLPDGSRVWLNAASSIRYPTKFSGKERQVQVTGEAYFEVMPDSRRPFTVLVNGDSKVEVLGTAFNINAYADEQAIRTTLVAGAVRVTVGRRKLDLAPGQQALHNEIAQEPQLLSEVDIDKVTAWKNGLFNFENAGLEEVMRQIARWYDIEVVYENTVPRLFFGGKMSRGLQLDAVLKGLEGARVHFRLEGRRLIVMP